MKGLVYFTDGHIEDIVSYDAHSDDSVIFHTESGTYAYERTFEHITPTRGIQARIPVVRFYKLHILEPDNMWYVEKIDKIEIITS